MLLREAYGSTLAVSPDQIMTEIVALQLFLTNALSPVACGERMSAEQYQELMRNVKTNKHRAAREVVAQYVAENEEENTMPETNWGRKETIIWPPHKPIYTFGAVFLAVILTGLFVYLHFAFVLTPLQQFDLPIYIKASIVPSIRQSGKYQMLLMSDEKGHALYARDVDVAAGSTPQANAKPIPLVLSDSARQRGMVYLYRSVPTVYQNSSLVGYFKQQVYNGANDRRSVSVAAHLRSNRAAGAASVRHS